MRAYRLTAEGRAWAEVPEPEPGPGEVLIEVAAAGLCHSDLTLASRDARSHPFSLPITLGHELSGVVASFGPGGETSGLEVGQLVAGYGPRGCGSCGRCLDGAANLCRGPALGFPPGIGADGALAERIVVAASSVVPADGVPAEQAAVLTDAGLTAWHAVRRVWSPDAGTAVVIGVGGLGHLAVQMLRLLGVTTVVAVDPGARQRELASSFGAVAVSPSEVDGVVAEVAHGRGADIVMDFVASGPTLEQVPQLLGVGGRLSIVGVGGARLAVGAHALPLGTTVDLPFWGTRSELVEVLDLARSGSLHPVVEQIDFAAVEDGYARLAAGAVVGRLAAVH